VRESRFDKKARNGTQNRTRLGLQNLKRHGNSVV
jgi:hypothetical protein